MADNPTVTEVSARKRFTPQHAVRWIAERIDDVQEPTAEATCILFAAAFLDVDATRLKAAIDAYRAKARLDAALAALSGTKGGA
jgi:hypothetical protein